MFPSWKTLGIRAIPLAAVLWVAARTYVQLPLGVCFDDSGDLQTASATLGILHPPGYGGFAFVGWLVTKAAPWVEPARAVTLFCWVAGLAALWCAGRIVARTIEPAGAGFAANVLGAAAILALAGLDSWRDALTAPEVYAPAVAMVAAAALLLIRPQRFTRHEWFAAALAGFACGQRPPLLPACCGCAVVAWPADRPRRVRMLGWAAILVTAVGFSPLFVAVRDAQDAEYNYIEQFLQNEGGLPPRTAGLEARVERAWWITSAAQFRFLLADRVDLLPARARWCLERLAFGGLWGGVAALGLAALGGVQLWRTARRKTAIIALSIGVPALGYLLCTRMTDNAADFLPVQLAIVIFMAGLLPRPNVESARRSAAAPLAVLLLALSAVHGWGAWGSGSGASREMDAGWYAARLDFASLPPESTIITGWRESTVLCYERLVHTGRRDVRILHFDESRWAQVTPRVLAEAARQGNAPVFWAREYGAPPGATLAPFRTLFRVVPSDAAGSSP